MPTFHTVIPIHNVDLDPEGHWEFSGGLVLVALPTWVREQPMLENLSSSDREAFEDATHGFVVTYQAAGLGDPDLEWKGPDAKSIQETKYEHGVLANFALWLSRPCPIHFIIVLHALQFGGKPTVQQTVRCSSRLLCHPRDGDARITAEDLAMAARLHGSLLALTRDTALWTAVRATWAGLQMNIETIRYVLLWIALEAFFGPEDAREITYRLSQRVGFFLRKNRTDAQQLFATTKTGYSFRSKIVHGRWKENMDSQKRMAEAESLTRDSLVRILEDPALTKTFSEKTRERFLDDLVFKNGGLA